MKRTLTTFSTFALFAGAAMAAEPTKTVESIENEENVSIASDEYLQATGAYYRDGGKPDGQLHKGPVVNVGNMKVDGIFEVKATDQNANRLFDVKNVFGAGEIRFGRGVYISQESDFSNFDGTLTLFTAINEQGNKKASGAYFLSGVNNPSNIKAFNLEENTTLSFTNGDYTLNGKIGGAGKISARTLGDLNFEGDKILENATPANVVIKGDISGFSGIYTAEESSFIKLETKLADNVVFVGATGGTLELLGAGGDARKTITVDSHSETSSSGNVFMYGNKAIITNNSRAGGTVDGDSGTIYFGGNNAYTQSEKLVYTFDKTNVRGSSAGHVTVGGKGVGSVMEDGADITVDGVNVGYLTAGAFEGGVVNGDINVLVKSGDVMAVYGGRGGVHTGKTTITVEDGKVGTIAIGDYYGGKVNGDMVLNVTGGEINQVYGANYRASGETVADFNGVNGNVQINISGGTVKNIRGGINTNQPGDAATAKSKMVLNGNVEININGNAKITQDDGESILAVGGSYGSVNGNTTVNISDNATVEGIIAMGGSRNDAAVKSTFLNIGGGTLNGDVYAGALKAATVLGDTNTTISGGTLNGDIYGGGSRADTIVKGNSNITLSGSVAKINGTIYGGGKDGSIVEGSKNLFVGTGESAYVGSSALKVADFQKIDIVNGSANFASFTQAAEGTLVSISDKGKLSMSLNSASQLSDTSFENAGELVFKRGSLSDSDSVALKSYTGSGNVSAYGGTFADGVFAAGKSAAFDSSAITVGTGVNDVQSVRLADKLALDFNVAGLGEAAITVNEVRESTDTTGIDGKVLAAFDVNVSDNDNNYTVVFSAYVGALEDAGVLTAWHKGSDGVWTKLDTAIDYANEIASITVDGFSSYAFAAAVPEPATIAAILGAVALSFVVFRRRK